MQGTILIRYQRTMLKEILFRQTRYENFWIILKISLNCWTHFVIFQICDFNYLSNKISFKIDNLKKQKKIKKCLLNVYLNTKTQLKAKLASEGGSQCGYCSPGMVMQLHSWLQEHSTTTQLDLDNILDGNICRCTGYRIPIRCVSLF